MRVSALLLVCIGVCGGQYAAGSSGWQQQQAFPQQQQQQQQQRLGQQYSGQQSQYGAQSVYGQQPGGIRYLGPGPAYPQNGFLQNRGTAVTQSAALNSNIISPSKLSDASVNGAQVDIRITGYQNPNNLLSNTTTCACTTNCNFLSSDQQNACKFSFVTIISAADQSIQYFATDFFPFNQQLTPGSGNWSQPMSFQMTTKPVAIDIFAYDMGVVISLPSSSGDQQLLYFDKLVLVDSFVIDVFSYDASYGQQKTEQLTGKMIGTTLSVVWSVNCINGMMGKSCNLVCGVSPNASSIVSTTANYNQKQNNQQKTAKSYTNTNTVLCQDTYGNYKQCQYNTAKTQVTNCLSCTNGVTSDGQCSGIYTDTDYDGVSAAFRTWTIVLGVLLGVALLVILCLIIAYVIVRNREKAEEEYKSNGNYPIAQSTAARPLLEDEWSAPPRRNLPPTPPHDASRAASDESYRPQQAPRQEHQV